MKKIELVGIDQNIFYEKLENGLEVYFVPYKNKKNYSVHYVTKYGSLDTNFVPINEKEAVKVPDGIAHFLEHKMFEQEDGVDPFSFFSNSGTDCNASTSFKSTCYLFEGTNHLEENLEYLLTYVNRPYFTEENVEKEKGIIAEEIKMYDDNPDWLIERMMREATFHKDHIRVDIAGTVDSINKITKDDLYLCYHTFYQPSNMFLLATGNIDPIKMLDIIKKNKYLAKRKTNQTFTVIEEKEPKTVKTKYQEVNLSVMNKKLALTIKIPWPKNSTNDKFIYDLYCGLILTNIFGQSSLITEEMKRKDLATSFVFGRERTSDYITFNFIANTEYPNKLVDYVLDKLKTSPLLEEDIERTKKVWITGEIVMIDDTKTTLDNIYYDLIEFGRIITNKVELIHSLNLETAKKIRKELDLSNYSVIVINPQK